jgi:hypothetical protein
VLPAVVGRLRGERPGLAVRCEEEDENDVLVGRLLADELDLTFLIGEPDDPAVESVTLLVDPFVLVSPNTGIAPVVDPGRLGGVAMIGQSPCACQLSIDRALRDLGVEPDYVFRTNDNAAVQAMVRAGMGCAILPHLAVDRTDPGVVVSTMDPPMPRVLVLARRRGERCHPLPSGSSSWRRRCARFCNCPSISPLAQASDSLALVAQELLELGCQLVAAGQVVDGPIEIDGLLLGLVVQRLELLHHRPVLVVAAHEHVDALALISACRPDRCRRW